VIQHLKARADLENGAIVVLFALVLVVLFAFVAMAIDLSRLFHQRQLVQNAVDFGALAGAQNLPATGAAQGAAASTGAIKVTMDNASSLTASAITTSFKCLISDNNNAPALASDVPYVCGPATGTWAANEWTKKGNHWTHPCNPAAGDKCNTIIVSALDTVKYFFAPVIGVSQGTTGSVAGASCRGSCGAAPNPMDVALILDRSGSMSDTDVTNARNAALTLLTIYTPPSQQIALLALPYKNVANPCYAASKQIYPDTSNVWVQVGLNSDYQTATGALNPASALVQGLNCMKSVRATAGGITVTPTGGSGHTDLGDPITAATNMLQTTGRPGVPKAIILLTDGAANQPWTMNPCGYAIAAAAPAKAAGIDVFTIAFGAGTDRCTDKSGPWVNVYATTQLAATATTSVDNQPGGCAATENTDGDHYFCLPKSADLTAAFRQVAAASLGFSRLIDV
jgi:Putative Flp pilus-assembly TadE/G-like/von Willebrand factor type A domain